MILANAYIPLASLAPIGQILVLIFIIIFETRYISRRLTEEDRPNLWRKVTVANLITAGFGLLIALIASVIETWLIFGWGSQPDQNPTLFWLACFIYGSILPWFVWFFCYQLSWRFEASFISQRIQNTSNLKVIIISAHRWSYGFLAIPIMLGCLYYIRILITVHP